jgi:hypothetical protein
MIQTKHCFVLLYLAHESCMQRFSGGNKVAVALFVLSCVQKSPSFEARVGVKKKAVKSKRSVILSLHSVVVLVWARGL